MQVEMLVLGLWVCLLALLDVPSESMPESRLPPLLGPGGADEGEATPVYLETALRYSWLDLSNDGIRGGWLEEWSLSLNWVLFSNLSVRNNYVLSRSGDRTGTLSGMAHSWVTRFQVDF